MTLSAPSIIRFKQKWFGWWKVYNLIFFSLRTKDDSIIKLCLNRVCVLPGAVNDVSNQEAVILPIIIAVIN